MCVCIVSPGLLGAGPASFPTHSVYPLCSGWRCHVHSIFSFTPAPLTNPQSVPVCLPVYGLACVQFGWAYLGWGTARWPLSLARHSSTAGLGQPQGGGGMNTPMHHPDCPAHGE